MPWSVATTGVGDMCRWIAYSGRPIYLEDALFKPENSLINQSRNARWTTSTVNADGFGVGWYGEKSEPGLFRDVLPAWNDDNLRSVSEQIRSRLFFAHVRASTGTAISRVNCHPFRYEQWLFMHNGLIGGFEQIRRDLEFRIAPEFYARRLGTTDSETFFYLLLSNGLETDAIRAIRLTLVQVLEVLDAAGVTEPFKMTAAVTDGERILALRFASDDRPPTLFYGYSGFPSRSDSEMDGAAILVLSEPLDSDAGNWIEIAPSQLLFACEGAIDISPLDLGR